MCVTEHYDGDQSTKEERSKVEENSLLRSSNGVRKCYYTIPSS